MQEIKLSIGTHERTFSIPSAWDELTPSQFVFIVSHPAEPGNMPTKAIRHLLQLTQEEELFLLPAHLYALWEQMQWLLHPETITQWVLDKIELSDGRTVYPPAADFDNVTWEEFVFADQLASAENWAAVAACLYRPKKEDPNEDEDDRIPFTRYGASNRLELFTSLSVPLKKAVEVNYLALRKHITDRYRYLFTTAHGKGEGSGWVEVSHQVLGDTIWEEEQLMHTSVDQVLSHLNHIIHENQQRKRHEAHR